MICGTNQIYFMTGNVVLIAFYDRWRDSNLIYYLIIIFMTGDVVQQWWYEVCGAHRLGW